MKFRSYESDSITSFILNCVYLSQNCYRILTRNYVISTYMYR